MILGLLDGPPAHRVGDFLVKSLHDSVGVVDFVSLLMAAKVLELSSGIDVLADAGPHWRDSVVIVLEKLRRDDGGFAKSEEGRAGSTYQTFLTLLAYQIIERSPPEPTQIVDFLKRHAHPDGGFLEIRVGKRAGVNPTAAAIGSLKMLGSLEDQQLSGVADFLQSLQTDEGGWAANTRIPLADVLSTFTALVTSIDLNGASGINRRAAHQYLLSMERPAGGFAGFALDPAEDVEYTFYGLSGLGLLASLELEDE